MWIDEGPQCPDCPCPGVRGPMASGCFASLAGYVWWGFRAVQITALRPGASQCSRAGLRLNLYYRNYTIHHSTKLHLNGAKYYYHGILLNNRWLYSVINDCNTKLFQHRHGKHRIWNLMWYTLMFQSWHDLMIYALPPTPDMQSYSGHNLSMAAVDVVLTFMTYMTYYHGLHGIIEAADGQLHTCV